MALYIIDEDGKILGTVADNDAANALLATVPDDIYVFDVGGMPDEVEAFMLRLNEASVDGKSFFDQLREKHGTIPLQINPFLEMRDILFQYNTSFIKIKEGLADTDLAGQLFQVLQDTYSAGSSFFLLLALEELEEGLQGVATDENPQVFYAVDAADSHSGADDVVIVESIA
jgi:hypothetical protein